MRFLALLLVSTLGLTGCLYGHLPSSIIDVDAVEPTLLDIDELELGAQIIQNNLQLKVQILDGTTYDISVLKTYSFQMNKNNMMRNGSEFRMNNLPSNEDPSVTLSGILYRTRVGEGSDEWISGELILRRDSETALILDIEGYF